MIPRLTIAMPKPPFGPHVDAVQKRERILALSRRIFELAARTDESDECDPQTVVIITQMERIIAAIEIHVFVRRRAMARIAKDDDEGVVNVQLSHGR